MSKQKRKAAHRNTVRQLVGHPWAFKIAVTPAWCRNMVEAVLTERGFRLDSGKGTDLTGDVPVGELTMVPPIDMGWKDYEKWKTPGG